MRQVSQGALLDFAIFPIGLTQQDGGWRVTVGDALDVHGYKSTLKLALCLVFLYYYMGTASRFTLAEFCFPHAFDPIIPVTTSV